MEPEIMKKSTLMNLFDEYFDRHLSEITHNIYVQKLRNFRSLHAASSYVTSIPQKSYVKDGCFRLRFRASEGWEIKGDSKYSRGYRDYGR